MMGLFRFQGGNMKLKEKLLRRFACAAALLVLFFCLRIESGAMEKTPAVLSIQDVEPPTEQIKEAFSEVENARQNKESALNEANQYRNEQIPAAEAKADNIIQKAEAKKASRINEANGQAARFNAGGGFHEGGDGGGAGDGGFTEKLFFGC